MILLSLGEKNLFRHPAMTPAHFGPMATYYPFGLLFLDLEGRSSRFFGTGQLFRLDRRRELGSTKAEPSQWDMARPPPSSGYLRIGGTCGPLISDLIEDVSSSPAPTAALRRIGTCAAVETHLVGCLDNDNAISLRALAHRLRSLFGHRT